METKTFGDKKIIIREFNNSDLKQGKKFQDHINSLVAEEAKILINSNQTLKQEQDFLFRIAAGYKNKTRVYLVVECDNKVIGGVGIDMGRESGSHVGHFGITIRNGYRGMGLGEYLMKKILVLAKKKLKPKLIELEAFSNNKPAINLYKKMGFKVVAKIPKKRLYKGKFLASIIMTKEV